MATNFIFTVLWFPLPFILIPDFSTWCHSMWKLSTFKDRWEGATNRLKEREREREKKKHPDGPSFLLFDTCRNMLFFAYPRLGIFVASIFSCWFIFSSEPPKWPSKIDLLILISSFFIQTWNFILLRKISTYLFGDQMRARDLNSKHSNIIHVSFM